MKKIVFFLFCCVLFAASCSKNAILPQERSLVVEKDFQTKGMKEIEPDQLDTAFFVSVSDIESYTKFKILLSKGAGQELSVLDIRPVGPTDDVVLCYLINYSEGWEVISADRRAPVVLASQEEGYLNFDECESNEAMQDVVSWIGYLASDVLCLRQQPEFVPEEEEDIQGMEASLSFWTSIIEPESILGYPELPTKGGGTVPPPQPTGHWELTGTEVEIIDYQVYDFCGTSWHQDSPYNAYAPLKTDGSNQHAPAGCVAVAGAQMLYCLFQKFGYPTIIPITATSSGDINTYSFSPGLYSMTGWTMIGNGNTDTIAILLAYLGDLLPNVWGNEGTGATMDDLQVHIFNSMGYSCTLGNYSSSTALTSLQNSQLPIVADAFDEVFFFLGNTVFWLGEGHAFLIDRYKKVRQKTTYTYEWVYDVPPGEGMIDLIEPITEVVYGEPYVSNLIGMNWGWGASYNNTWYQSNGNWHIRSYDFDYDRTMMYNFNHI